MKKRFYLSFNNNELSWPVVYKTLEEATCMFGVKRIISVVADVPNIILEQVEGKEELIS